MNNFSAVRNKISCSDCDTQDCLIRQYCSSSWVEMVDRDMDQVWIGAGERIFREGSTVFGAFFIQQGGVKIMNEGDNKEQIVRLSKQGDILGHKGGRGDKYNVSAVALSNVVLCFLDNQLLHDLFMANPGFTHQVMKFYSRELRKAESRIKYLAQMNTREKVAEALLYAVEIFGINPKEQTLNADLTRQDIAGIAGTTAEQITRQLKDFESENLIVKDGRSIKLVNVEGFERIIQDFDVNVLE